MVLAHNVKRLRELKGWSQRDLASESDVSQPFISKIESGSKDVTSKVLIRIATALGVSVAELLEEEPATKPTGTDGR